MKIINNQIILNDGSKVDLPRKGHVNLKMINNDGREWVFLNGKEWKDGKFKVTFNSLLSILY